MILVFYASLAPRGYGRTFPRPPRVYLPFVANLAQLAAFRHLQAGVLVPQKNPFRDELIGEVERAKRGAGRP